MAILRYTESTHALVMFQFTNYYTLKCRTEAYLASKAHLVVVRRFLSIKQKTKATVATAQTMFFWYFAVVQYKFSL